MKIRVLGFILLVILTSSANLAFGNQSLPLEPFSTGFSGSDTFLQQEAGISAYTQILSVNLDRAEAAMDTVEARTVEYVIGSIGLEDYEEKYDVHVYVDTAGWVVAYYSKNAHASKIIDWVGFSRTGQLTTSKLEIAINSICSEMYVPVPSNIKYFDFRYPEANRIMIAVDEEEIEGATETFNIFIPSDIAVYNRTWSHCAEVVNNAYYTKFSGNIKIDSTTLNQMDDEIYNYYIIKWANYEGEIT